MKKEKYEKITISLLILGLILSLSNQIQLMGANSGNPNLNNGIALAEASIIPKGTPEIYGKELDISYDDVSLSNPRLADQTIEKMAYLDRTISLEGKNLERYIKITSEISCEYCCGVQSIIFRKEDVEARDLLIEQAIASGEISESDADQYRIKAGDAACGCAHSFAMRGLAKYLISEHDEEFTNEEILTELAKWKTLYFPSQMMTKSQALENEGIEFSYINLGSNTYRDIEKGTQSSSQMVGGC